MTDTIRSKRPQPCNGCPDRCTACSDHCKKEAFLAWEQEQETIRKNRNAYYTKIWSHAETDPNNYRSGKKKK